MSTALSLVPNFDHDAERACLAACLIAPVAAMHECDDVGLQAADFADDRHLVLFRAMHALRRTGSAIDPVTLGAFLERHGVLDRAGGRELLGALLQEIPSAANVRYYAKLVRAAAKARAGRDDRKELDVQSAQVGEAQAFLDLPANRFLRLPWPRLDAVLGGTMPGTLCFVAGHPGGGKTSWLLTLMLRLLAEGKRIYYAGLESRPNILRTQVACRVLGIDHGEVLAGNAQRLATWEDDRRRLVAELERQRDADGVYGRLRFAPQHHIDTGAACDLMARAAEWGADLVIVDHIDHVTAENARGPYVESRQVVQALDSLTKAHQLVTVASTQTNWTGRQGDPYRDHRPIREEHLFMGGHKSQVAHWVLGVYRPCLACIPKDLRAAIAQDPKRITEALLKNTTAVNVLKARVLGEGKHAVVHLGFWRGEVLDEPPRVVREWSGEAGAA